LGDAQFWWATLVGVMSDEVPRAVRGDALLRRGIVLERVTLGWNVVGIVVLVGLVANTALGWWWADPLAGFVIVFYGLREAMAIFTE
jgi:Co/Zn/Cd efflux system component